MAWSDAARRAALEARRLRRRARIERARAVRPTFTQRDLTEYANQYTRDEVEAELKVMIDRHAAAVDIANWRLLLKYLS